MTVNEILATIERIARTAESVREGVCSGPMSLPIFPRDHEARLNPRGSHAELAADAIVQESFEAMRRIKAEGVTA